MAHPRPTGHTRRALLCGAALAVTGGCGPAVGPSGRQAGVTTPQQRYLLLAAYDLAPGGTAADLRALLARLPGPRSAPGLTATVGVGPGLPARLGLAAPAALRDLPPLPGDRLDPARGGGDLVVQYCADDPTTAVAAAGALDRAAAPLFRPRWRQQGFLPPSPPGETPRNLFGFKDGTANPGAGECDHWVWLADGEHRDGTFLVVRRIRMLTEAFDRQPVADREAVVGRHLATGAPLGQAAEFAEPDLFAKNPDGSYVLPVRSHVRLAHPRLDGGARMLRRGYSYADGPGDRGLVFLAFMRDPALFARVQHRLATDDALSGFVEHTASAVFFVLPGARPGRALGASLFGSPAR